MENLQKDETRTDDLGSRSYCCIYTVVKKKMKKKR